MATRYERLLDLIDQANQSNIGYDQGQRWSYMDKANRRIIPNREGDCSAVTSGLFWLAGYPIQDRYICNAGNTANYTGNATDVYAVDGVRTRDVRGLSVAQIQAIAGPGDALLGDGHIMVMGRNRMWFSMNHDENGGIIGGQAGEQVADESCFRALWARRGGWLYLFQPTDKTATAAPTTSSVLENGSTGTAVRALQGALNVAFPAYAKLAVDGVYGDATSAAVKEFQRRAGLVADGVVGPLTRAKLATYGVRF